jgi:hypothetical protein
MLSTDAMSFIGDVNGTAKNPMRRSDGVRLACEDQRERSAHADFRYGLDKTKLVLYKSYTSFERD